MNKIVSLLRLGVVTKHTTVTSAARIAGPDTSPHPLLVTASSNLVTEAVKVCRQMGKKRLFVEVKATLAPRQDYNLISCAKVKWLGREDEIEDLEPSISYPIIANEAALRPTGCIDLGVIFHKAGNLTRTWSETFFVVEQLWTDMELILGGTMCENAKITGGDRVCPVRMERISEEERKQDEENREEARKRAEAKMAAEARELLSKGNKKPEGATDQSK